MERRTGQWEAISAVPVDLLLAGVRCRRRGIVRKFLDGNWLSRVAATVLGQPNQVMYICITWNQNLGCPKNIYIKTFYITCWRGIFWGVVM
jgi:hypothetical protein